MRTNELCTSEIVRAEEFSYAFQNGRSVLHKINLSVHSKGVHTIIGPSGSGKSTFLMAVAGLLDLGKKGTRASGNLRVSAHPVDAESKDFALRNIGFVFQKPLPFRMSIRKNIELVLKEHGVHKSEREGKMEQALREANLWTEVQDKLQSSATTLSGGQQQRLCLARTLALRPSLLILDEPCSALDPVSTRAIEDTFVQLSQDRTLLLVTHNLGQARRISKKVSFFWMTEQGGQCLETAPAERFFVAPSTPTARSYLQSEWGLDSLKLD